MLPQKILEDLEYAPDRRKIMKVIETEAETKDILSALDLCEDNFLSQLLLDILGNRKDAMSVDKVSLYLSADESNLRSSAAEALTKIGDPSVGEKILRCYETEIKKGVRHNLILAMGAIKYHKAIGVLIDALHDSDPVLRGCAAWSLEQFNLASVVSKLEKALKYETHEYAKTRMKSAINKLRSEIDS